MTSKVEAALKHLASCAENLNRVSDDISRHLTTIEDALNAYKLGVSAWITLHSENEWQPEGYPLTLVHKLGYDKHEGKWGLLVNTYYEETSDPFDSDVRFLKDAPRELRIMAVDKIAELAEALANAGRDTAEKAEAAVPRAKELADALKRPG